MDWNSIFDPPKNDGTYLILIDNKQYELGNFNHETKTWECKNLPADPPITVTHWAKLPERPEFNP